MSQTRPTTIELLAPAGNLEKLKVALEFGADAVYFGVPDFSLRARVNHFDWESMKKGADYCREKGKKFYITLNIYAHNTHLSKLPDYLEFINGLHPDGLIVSDPGILDLARQLAPEIPLHLSTQANATNSAAVRFWSRQGIKRVILARELTLPEIGQIRDDNPEMELECFVHGAMCMAYSGRCILSKWMAGRSANLGDCAQPCRWKFNFSGSFKDSLSGCGNGGDGRSAQGKQAELVDDLGKFQVRAEEDCHGTYLFNSYDMCLLEHLAEIQAAGIDSIKIEGRAKSVYYLAVTVRAYRRVLDALKSGQNYQQTLEGQMKELATLANRGYSKGFLLGNEPPHLFSKDTHRNRWMFCGIAHGAGSGKSRQVLIHNYVAVGETVEIITPAATFSTRIEKIYKDGCVPVETAHGGGKEPYLVELSVCVEGIFLMRKDAGAVIP